MWRCGRWLWIRCTSRPRVDVSRAVHASRTASLSSKKQIIDEDVLSVLVPDLQNQDPRDRPLTSATASRSPKVDPTQSLQELPIMHISATHNNTMATITDHLGKTLAWTSAGAEGYKNARKGTSFAGQAVGSAAAKKALALGLRTFRVKLKGTGPGRSASLRGLQLGGVSIALLQDVTPVPHNGCKPRKARRL